METTYLLPDHDDDSTAFWQGCARGELLVQTCSDCGKRRMPPRPMCPACNSLTFAWQPVSGRAVIWSFVAPHPPLLPAYAELAPYNVIVVALDEDRSLRLVGNLVADANAPINSLDPTSITIGEKVRVAFQQVGDTHLPRWIRDNS